MFKVDVDVKCSDKSQVYNFAKRIERKWNRIKILNTEVLHIRQQCIVNYVEAPAKAVSKTLFGIKTIHLNHVSKTRVVVTAWISATKDHGISYPNGNIAIDFELCYGSARFEVVNFQRRACTYGYF